MKQRRAQVKNPLSRLQAWYLGECNGDWEHSYGITIETLDNPGWQLTIDLLETRWATTSIPLKVVKRSNANWTHVQASTSRFVAAGGPENLEEIIELFFELVVDSSKPRALRDRDGG